MTLDTLTDELELTSFSPRPYATVDWVEAPHIIGPLTLNEESRSTSRGKSLSFQFKNCQVEIDPKRRHHPATQTGARKFIAREPMKIGEKERQHRREKVRLF